MLDASHIICISIFQKCNQGWVEANNGVACKKLGFMYGYPSEVNTMIPKATGPIGLSNVNCTSSEETLYKCSHSGWYNNNCTHDQDVHIICS